MRLEFFKYQATGNDFIIIDDRSRLFDIDNNSLIQTICHRRFGVGADGLILLRNSLDADFEMIYYNADGYLGSMCGNGGRCISAFASEILKGKTQFRFQAFDGIHQSSIVSLTDKGFIVELEMKSVPEPSAFQNDYLVDTGSPHYIRFVKDVTSVQVMNEGRLIRNSGPFIREGVNVNFVEPHQNQLTVRTYERGVEDETLSCGTGVTASAIAAYQAGIIKQTEINVSTRGGNLTVRFEPSEGIGFDNVYLIGEAAFVFKGTLDV